MLLTDEQQEIIQCASGLKRNQTLKIEACAGSGKTSTLVEIAKANSQSRFLYLAFNRAIVQDARKKFPANVKVMTTHGLAYQWVILNKFPNLKVVSSFKVFDLQPLFPNLSYLEIKEILDRFKVYANSSAYFCEHENTRKFMRAMYDGKIPFLHDFYLKLFQLNKHKGLDAYDYILLDEAQDTNDVTLSIFGDNTCRKILVGDSQQSIYGFRGAVNALSKVDADFYMHLSKSFRSKQEILDRANYFVMKCKQENDYIPMQSMYKRDVNAPKTKAIITRTNAGLITEINSLTKKRLGKFTLIKEPYSVFGLSMSVFYLSKKQKDKIDKANAYLNQFSSIKELEAYADETKDREIQGAIKIIDEYGSKIFDLYKQSKEIFANSSGVTTLTNAHLSKGLEWNEVTLADDFSNLMDLKQQLVKDSDAKTYQKNLFDLIQEVNLYYVAITRAKSKLTDFTPNDAQYQQHKLFSH